MTKESRNFCTCGETDCPMHPSNHDRGCDPCIRKNLKEGEIPSCFFNLVNDDLSAQDDFTIAGFVSFYLKNTAASAVDVKD